MENDVSVDIVTKKEAEPVSDRAFNSMKQTAETAAASISTSTTDNDAATDTMDARMEMDEEEIATSAHQPESQKQQQEKNEIDSADRKNDYALAHEIPTTQNASSTSLTQQPKESIDDDDDDDGSGGATNAFASFTLKDTHRLTTETPQETNVSIPNSTPRLLFGPTKPLQTLIHSTQPNKEACSSSFTTERYYSNSEEESDEESDEESEINEDAFADNLFTEDIIEEFIDRNEEMEVWELAKEFEENRKYFTQRPIVIDAANLSNK